MTLAQDYLYCIEEEFKLARAANLSRLSIQWGAFSRGMNLAIRLLCEQTDPAHPEQEGLQIIYNIWLCYSSLLEISHKFPQQHRKVQQKRGLIKLIKELKKEITYYAK